MACPSTGIERLLTIAEFRALPEEDAYRMELVRGRVIRSPRPASLHGVLAAKLGHRLFGFVEARNLGAVLADAGVVLSRDPDTVRGPDIAFFSPERIPEMEYATPFWGPPDLAVEITSPSNRASELEAKVEEYLEAGVRTVWVVIPSARVIRVYANDGGVRVLGEEDVLDGGGVLPGFRISLASYFMI